MKKIIFTTLSLIISGQVFAQPSLIKVKCVDLKYRTTLPETNIEIDVDTSTMRISSTGEVGFIDKNKRLIRNLRLTGIDCAFKGISEGIMWCRLKKGAFAKIEFADGSTKEGAVSGSLQSSQITRLSLNSGLFNDFYEYKETELRLLLSIAEERFALFELKAQSSLCDFESL